MIKGQLKHFKPSHIPTFTLSHKNDQWMAMSAFQKAVRYEDEECALSAVMAMMNSGLGVKAWKRLGIIAMEDIGLANPPLMALVIFLSKTKAMRAPYNESLLISYIIHLMCRSPKSRDLCDVVVWGLLDKADFKNSIHTYRDLPEEALKKIALNPHKSFQERLAAFWLAHPPRFRMQAYARQNQVQQNLYLSIAEGMKLPVVLGLCLHMGATHLHEALSYPIPFVWELMQPPFYTGPDILSKPPEQMIGNVYAASYDKHVRSGKQAMKIFLEESSLSTVLTSFGIHTPSAQFKALERAVFYMEGSVLGSKFYYPEAQNVYFDVLEAKVLHNGFNSLKEALTFYYMVQNQLPLLNEIRMRTIEQNLSLFETL